MSFYRIPEDGPALPDHPDASPGRGRPEEWVRHNAMGEAFHTYADPDRWPDMAKADELAWRRDHPREG